MSIQREIVYDTLAGFVSALTAAGINRVALALTDEKRGIEREPGVLAVERLRIGEFIAYRESTVYKYTARDDAITAAEAALSTHGIDCTRRDRNIM